MWTEMNMFTEKLQTGPVLFIGEGNFSFSLSIARRLAVQPCILATSFEQEWQLGEAHRQNVEQLRRIQGVEVIFGVDGTRLQTHPEISHRQYKHIVFNFPHTGGKSKIQRNRDLLRDFFISSSQILSKNGEILVNLCRGQGGTAADQEVREWHNSWQVVAMAAEANLTLYEVYPFDAKEFSNYTCVGFRSRDKSFHNESALTHVFVKGKPFVIPSTLALLQRLSDGRWCHTYFVEKVKHPMSKETEHPVNLTRQWLLDSLGEHTHVLSISDECLPLMTDRCLCSGELKKKGLCHHIPIYQSRPCKDQLDCYHKNKYTNGKLAGCESTATEDDCIPLSTSNSKPDFPLEVVGALRHSTVDYVPLLLSSSPLSLDDLLVSCGPVYRNVPIHTDCCPVSEEMLGCSLQPVEYLKSLLSDILLHWLDLCNIIFTPLKINNGQTIVKYNIEAEHHFYQQLDINNGCCGCLKSDASDPKIFKTKSTQLGQLFLMVDDGAPVCSGFVIDVLIVTKLKFNIRDWRILLSHNMRKHCCGLHQNIHYISECLYPPTFVHDVSFWVNEVFTEMDFYCLVRSVCGDMVCNILLLDEYTQLETGRLSRCYRLTYQSLNNPLSHKLALDMQLLLRSKLETVLCLELR